MHRHQHRHTATTRAATRAPIRAGTAAAGMLLATSGCVGAPPGGPAEPPLDAVTPVTSVAQIRLPLVDYLVSAEEEKAFFSATQLAQRACAARFGVMTEIPVASQPAAIDFAVIRRYGLVDRDEVNRYGYAFPPPARPETSTSQGWNPDAQELAVMTGHTETGQEVTTDPVSGKDLPQGGCSLQGERDVTQGAVSPADASLVEDLLNEAWDRTRADSRALDAQRRWANCMEENGHRFIHRWDAGNSLTGSDPEAEFAMAVTDLACAEAVNYVGVWHAVDVAHQEELIAEHESDLQALAEDRRLVRDRVVALLRGDS